MKKYLKLTLLIVWLGVIYYLSGQDGATSSNLSSGLLKQIATLLNIKDIDIFVENFGSIFRELAHFGEYLILAILIYINIFEYSSKNLVLLTIILCLVYAISDEIHQIFISDRVFDLFDIVIDLFGSIVGSFISSYVFKKCSLEKKL